MKTLVQNALSWIAVATALTAAHPAIAAVIVNGDFSNGLNGWSVAANPDTVSIAGGHATINETGETVVNVSTGIATASQSGDFSVLEIDLYQVFTVPTAPQTLQFTLNNLTPDTSGLNPPPGFGASLLDPTSKAALVSTVNGTTDSYFTQDPTTGIASYTSDVTVSTDPLSNLTRISEDISGLTVGSQAEILFRLIEGGDLSTTASISNVELFAGPSNPGGSGNPNQGGGNPVVPEPSSMLLFGLGMAGMAIYGRRASRLSG